MAIGIRTEATRLLSEVGFLGLSRGLPKQSAVVFSALAALRPDQEVGTIGLGLSLLAAGDPARATDVLKSGPQTDAVLAFTCMACARSGDLGLAKDLNEDLHARGAAQEVLEIADDAIGAAATT